MGIPILDIPGVKDGIRVGLSLVLFESLGLLVGFRSLLGSTFPGDCTWAAVTIAVISSPLVGSVSQKGLQRICGSIIGIVAQPPPRLSPMQP